MPNTKKNTKQKYNTKSKKINLLKQIKKIANNPKLVVIGIVSAPYLIDNDSYITSYIPSSYIKWLESAGAIVVPLQYDLPKTILLSFLKRLHGIVLVGGSVPTPTLHSKQQFIINETTIKYILDYVINENNDGNYYPIWSTCMSFEIIPRLLLENKLVLRKNFRKDYLVKYGKVGESIWKFTDTKSRTKSIFNAKEIKIMKTNPSIYYTHTYSFDIKSNFIKQFEDIAIITGSSISSSNIKKIEYVASYELKHYPIYGVQFHPEKPKFSIPTKDIFVSVSKKLAIFFINECKKNKNIWVKKREILDDTIANYKIYNTVVAKHLKTNKLQQDKESINSSYMFGPLINPELINK